MGCNVRRQTESSSAPDGCYEHGHTSGRHTQQQADSAAGSAHPSVLAPSNADFFGRPRSGPPRSTAPFPRDNFYDRTGETTKKIFSQLSLATKAKPLLTVAGNHDYWVLGGPEVGTTSDQYANGHMQYYGQDTKAGEGVTPASKGPAAVPLNFSIDPHAGHVIKGGNLPAIENSFLCKDCRSPALSLAHLRRISPSRLHCR